MKKKRRWVKWVVLVLLVLIAVAVFISLSSRAQSARYEEETVTAGDMTTYYNFDGTVHAPRMQTITAAGADTVERVYVTQNQQVSKGDRLYSTKGGGIVRADMDGEVTGLFVTEGDVTDAAEVTVQIIDTSSLEARLNVDEYDVGAVTPGTPVQVTVLAPDAQITGTVSTLDKNGTASGDLSYYTATVPLGDVQGVYPGMQVSAKVLRGHVEGVAILKLDAVRFDEYNEPYVLVPGTDDEAERVSVTVGLSDGVHCEITSGLSVGDTVLVSTGLSLADIMQQMQQSSN